MENFQALSILRGEKTPIGKNKLVSKEKLCESTNQL